MTWKKHFKAVSTSIESRHASTHDVWNSSVSSSKFSSILPEIYAGHPERVQRYYQYEEMGRDSDISAALDTIADFCTQSEEQNDQPFLINWGEEPTEPQVKIIQQALRQWIRVNKFKSKLWRMVRDCAQFGDAFFVRDPEDHTWIWLDQYCIDCVKMKPDGKQEPEEYVVRNFNPNVTERYGTPVTDMSKYRIPGMTPQSLAKPNGGSGNPSFQIAGQDRDMRNTRHGQTMTQNVAIDARHIVHLSLNEQMDTNFPFGKSLLDPIFKTFKQKELLEDAIIIYRVQRAPERRIFYIDVGGMQGPRAQAYIEGIKNEIHQRRIPNRSGGGSMLDATYNPMSLLDDYFFAQCLRLNTMIPLLDGRELTLGDIIAEYQEGKVNYVYSLDHDHEMEPARISWAGVTRRNAVMLRVTLDNGSFVDATPDHPFIMRDGREVEAQHLAVGDSLMPMRDHHETVLITDVVVLEDREDTGDITVTGPSGTHVFAVSAGIFVHNSPEGKGSKVEVLPGGDANNDITDLTYFSKKMARGLRIPTSYLSLGDDEQPASYNDGKLGQAMIQEFRFNKFCMRIQGLLSPTFDQSFKEYLTAVGIQIDESSFELEFNPPQNFTKYRQIEIDMQQAQVYSAVAGNKVLSERYKLKRYLNMPEDDIIENERMWMEENPDAMASATGSTAADNSQEGDLGSVGFGGQSDFDIAPMDDMGDDMGDMGNDMGTEGLDLAPAAPTGDEA